VIGDSDGLGEREEEMAKIELGGGDGGGGSMRARAKEELPRMIGQVPKFQGIVFTCIFFGENDPARSPSLKV